MTYLQCRLLDYRFQVRRVFRIFRLFLLVRLVVVNICFLKGLLKLQKLHVVHNETGFHSYALDLTRDKIAVNLCL